MTCPHRQHECAKHLSPPVASTLPTAFLAFEVPSEVGTSFRGLHICVFRTHDVAVTCPGKKNFSATFRQAARCKYSAILSQMIHVCAVRAKFVPNQSHFVAHSSGKHNRNNISQTCEQPRENNSRENL